MCDHLGMSWPAEWDAAATELWPGFSPLDYPLAVFDGESTRLYHHPNPPAEFDSEQPDGLVFAGRHPAVVGNSTAQMGGVATATVIHHGGPGIAGEIAHETFHVFCRDRHPAWTANEVSALQYPVEDADVLASRRLEAAALRRAVIDGSAEWAATAVSLRQERFATMALDAVRYERDLERCEGLALYVEDKTSTVVRCEDALGDIRPDDVRRTAYFTGEAIAVLLDRFAPGWPSTMESDDMNYPDELLAGAIVDVAPAEYSAVEIVATADASRESIALMQAERKGRRAEFLARPGRIVLTAPDSDPFKIGGFDPMNVQHLGDGEVLHTRMLKLCSAGVQLEFYDATALTESAGSHPLFDGVRRVTFTTDLQ
jgi:hypothetical protein